MYTSFARKLWEHDNKRPTCNLAKPMVEAKKLGNKIRGNELLRNLLESGQEMKASDALNPRIDAAT